MRTLYCVGRTLVKLFLYFLQNLDYPSQTQRGKDKLGAVDCDASRTERTDNAINDQLVAMVDRAKGPDVGPHCSLRKFVLLAHAPQVGFEPTPSRVTVARTTSYSTVEYSGVQSIRNSCAYAHPRLSRP